MLKKSNDLLLFHIYTSKFHLHSGDNYTTDSEQQLNFLLIQERVW